MPVTAKLSRKFYERLGDDIAGELVDWFNSVDTEYQRQYREANDLNWERFKAELHAQGEELRAELRTQGSELRGEMQVQTARLSAEIARAQADLMKWMFLYWTGSVLALGSLMFGLIKSN